MMGMHNAIHPNSDVDRICLSRGRGGRSVTRKVHLSWTVFDNTWGWLLEAAKGSGVIDVKSCVEPGEFKEMRDKQMYEQFLREVLKEESIDEVQLGTS